MCTPPPVMITSAKANRSNFDLSLARRLDRDSQGWHAIPLVRQCLVFINLGSAMMIAPLSVSGRLFMLAAVSIIHQNYHSPAALEFVALTPLGLLRIGEREKEEKALPNQPNALSTFSTVSA